MKDRRTTSLKWKMAILAKNNKRAKLENGRRKMLKLEPKEEAKARRKTRTDIG